MPEDETTPNEQPPWAQGDGAPQFIPATPPPGPSPQAPPPPTAPAALDDDEDERPRPAIASLGAAMGGVITVFGLFGLLASSDVADSRGATIAISLAFSLLGVAITWIARSQRAIAGGVAISALAVVPLFGALFRDPKDALDIFGGNISSYRNTQMGVLACLALVWLASYLVGPGKRQAFFLGAGILALWLIPMTWFNLSATERALAPLNQLTSQTDPFDLGSGTGSSTSIDPLGGSGLDGTGLFGQGDDDHLALKLGITSLVFGVACLALGGYLDHDLRPRVGTPFFAAAAIILWQGIGYLEPDLKVSGASTIALILGCVAVWLGSRGGRRFTSWLGVAAASVAIVRLASEALDDKPGSTGFLLTVVGLIIVVGFLFLERAGAFGGQRGGGSAGSGARRPLLPEGAGDPPLAVPYAPAPPAVPGAPPGAGWGPPPQA